MGSYMIVSIRFNPYTRASSQPSWAFILFFQMCIYFLHDFFSRCAIIFWDNNMKRIVATKTIVGMTNRGWKHEEGKTCWHDQHGL